MLMFLRMVPENRVRRAISLLAPGRDFDSMPEAEMLHILGVAGVARLANVNRPVILQAVGPEGCSIVDLIAPATYGSFSAVGDRYPGAAPMLQGRGGGYVDHGARPAGASRAAAKAADVAPEYSPELVDASGERTYLAPPAGYSGERRPERRGPVSYPKGSPAEVARAPVYAAAPAVSPARAAVVAAARAAAAGGPRALSPARYGASLTSSAPAPRSIGPHSYGATEYSAPIGGRRERVALVHRRNGGQQSMAGYQQGMAGYYSNPYFMNPTAAGAVSAPELAVISGGFYPEPPTGAISAAGPAPAISGWPGAVPFRPDAWDFTHGVYTLQQGDTFSGLASTYLQSPARYLEIWHLQPYRYTKAIDPSSVTPSRPLVRAGEPVIMPPEATERAKSLVRSGAPTAPAIGGPVGGAVGAPWTAKKKMMVGAGVLAGVAVIGGGIYYATK
jgi:hypothetical protein